ncbi:TMEM165/GDT1 family protein [Salinilacihabitans rarus]|uniref:TMEM165/GDT1 family protein n=1 Tax=Salinilacihabitans rarus TaxID=2961596 RepID=UPI0020C84DFE|nr:TMEM165/GDT1 family protein [Salinilacihabitans rarus]
MSDFIEIVLTAFVLQLLALPGEKGQLVIAGLATEHDPYMVVAGAATAFGGWTAIEILLGNGLTGALPAVYLDAITAGLFVVFAVWLLYATPDDGSRPPGKPVTDGGSRFLESVQSSVPPRFRGFLPSFSLMVVGEFGDKTQLVTIGLAVQYGATSAIWIGEMLAIVPVSLVTALVFRRTADRFDRAWVHRVAAVTFGLFALDIAAEYAVGTSILPL